MAQCAFSNPDAKRDNLCFMNASFVASRASGIVSDHIQVRAECGHGEIFKKVAAGLRFPKDCDNFVLSEGTEEEKATVQNCRRCFCQLVCKAMLHPELGNATRVCFDTLAGHICQAQGILGAPGQFVPGKQADAREFISSLLDMNKGFHRQLLRKQLYLTTCKRCKQQRPTIEQATEWTIQVRLALSKIRWNR